MDDQRDVIKLQEQHLQSLENENKMHLATIQQLKTTVVNAERERDRNVSDSHFTTEKLDAKQSELDLKIRQVAELKEDNDAMQKKLCYVQQQYDSTVSERKALQKELNAIVEDRNVVREKLRVQKKITYKY